MVIPLTLAFSGLLKMRWSAREIAGGPFYSSRLYTSSVLICAGTHVAHTASGLCYQVAATLAKAGSFSTPFHELIRWQASTLPFPAFSPGLPAQWAGDCTSGDAGIAAASAWLTMERIVVAHRPHFGPHPRDL